MIYHTYRRGLCLTLAAMLAASILVTGCGSQESAETTSTTAATESAQEKSSESSTVASTAAADTQTGTEADVAVEETTPIRIKGINYNDNRFIDDYYVYVDVSYPVITCEEDNYGALNDGLAELNATLKKNIEAQADTVEEYARVDAENGILEKYNSYACQQTARLVRADSTVVSLLMTTYVNQGGAHPSTSYSAYNYDSQSGLALSLDEVIQDDAYQDLASTIAASLANTYDHDMFYAYMDLESASADGEVDGQTFTAALAEDIQAMIDNGTITYTIGQTGITFYFEAYSLAAYAAGPQYCTILYAEYPDIVWEGYTHAPANYITAPTGTSYGDYIENADGELISCKVTTSTEDEFSFSVDLTIMLDGETTTETVTGYSTNEYLVHSNGRNYLYVLASTENDWETLYVYDLNGSAATLVGSMERWFNSTMVSDPDQMELVTFSHILSTITLTRTYHVGDDGMPVSDMDYDLIEESAITTVNTLQDFTAEVRDTYDGTGAEETIPAGTALTFYATDNESWVDFTNEAGQYIRVEVTGDWPREVNGVDADTLFDNLVYAG